MQPSSIERLGSPNGSDTGSSTSLAYRFLQLCLRARCDTATLDAVRDLIHSSCPDWREVARLARVERIAPLIYSVVRERDLVPPELELELSKAYYTNATRVIQRQAALERILDCLDAAGVRVMLLKGMALATTIYDNVALRLMSDIDLLVRPADAQRTLDALAGLAYSPVLPDRSHNYSILHAKEIALRTTDSDDILVEIHLSLINSKLYDTLLDMDWFWQTAGPARFGQTGALLLGPEAQILHLCTHLVLHHPEGMSLLWKHDVAETILYYENQIDWNMMFQQAQANHIVLPLQQVLGDVIENWSVPIPGNMMTRLRELPVTTVEERAFFLFTLRHQSTAHFRHIMFASLLDWRNGWHYARSTLFPSRDYLRKRYGIQKPYLTVLYYPYLWLRGTLRLLRSVRSQSH